MLKAPCRNVYVCLCGLALKFHEKMLSRKFNVKETTSFRYDAINKEINARISDVNFQLTCCLMRTCFLSVLFYFVLVFDEILNLLLICAKIMI